MKEQEFLIDGDYGKIKDTTLRLSNMGDEFSTVIPEVKRCEFSSAQLLFCAIKPRGGIRDRIDHFKKSIRARDCQIQPITEIRTSLHDE